METTEQHPAERPARVLVAAPQPFYEDRGTPIAIRLVLEALSEQGYEVDVLTYPVGGPVDLPGLRIRRIPNPFRFRHVPIGLSLRKIILDGILAPALWSRLRTGRYLCVHAVEEAAFVAAAVAKPFGIPVIYDMQSSLPEQLTKYALFRCAAAQRVLRACERWVVRNTDIIACSSGLMDHVRKLDPSAKVAEWRYPGVWHDDLPGDEAARFRAELGLSDCARVVLYCGTFEPYQGLALLLDAAPHVVREHPDTTFLLIGFGSGSEIPVSDESRRLTESGTIRILPRQPRHMLHRYLALSDVVVSPRAYGGNLPLKIFDYMAAGKPIVATDNPTHRSVLDEGRAVLVGRCPEAFGAAIARLLADRAEGNRIGGRAKAYARENFGWPTFVERLRDLYDRALNGAGSDGRS